VILADTSVWVDHFRSGDADLAAALERGDVLCHPFVVGEVACGNVGNRREILRLLQDLPSAPVATHAEVLRFIEARSLMGRGCGYVDMHLLASAALSAGTRLWTRDRKLSAIAHELQYGLSED
jgi:hypothetical protein